MKYARESFLMYTLVNTSARVNETSHLANYRLSCDQVIREELATGNIKFSNLLNKYFAELLRSRMFS